ncbi:uncharacterized protein [Apostichopus japonicus]|uniref:uncharacterized protein isoform X2 n=1 Tax=Stichopus japonicus TaxID=307972 RepID=UPI003AB8A828
MAVSSNILNSVVLPILLIVVLNISMSLQNNTYSEAITDSIVSVKLHGDVCLICPYVFDASAGLSWRRGVNQSYLFRGEARTYDNIQLNLSINKCESKHYAMGVIDVRDGVNDGTYTCSKRSQRIASFQVHVQVTPTIQIVGESVIVHPDTRRVLAAIEGLYEEIQCVIFNAILPLNVTWLQNGISKRTESFLDVTKLEIKNLTSNFTFQMSVDAQILTCKVDGPFVEKQESYLYINSLKSGTPEDTSDNNDLYYVIVPILFTISTLTSLLMYYKVHRTRSTRMGIEDRMEQNTITFTANNKHEDVEVKYESPEDVVGEFYFYGDNTVLNRGDIILTSCISSTGRMTRWLASTKGKDRSLIVANTLRDNSTSEDWLQIKSLMEHLRHIPKHENVVGIVAADTIQIPYYIYTEYITNGTLRDVLCKAKHEDAYAKNIYLDGLSGFSQISDVQRIGSFLMGPLKAIFFLESIDDNIRLPWFAPETIFKKRYDRESDVWSFAVFIWEVFSQGASPFDGLDLMKFAAQPDALPVLPKPDLCSDSLYAIMTSCLKVNPVDRISLTMLKTKLFQLLENIA